MKDRIPTKPNRYAVYDDAHNFIRYEYHERADEPTQVGDALNKANLLPDAVATALGLTGNPQVKDALEKLKTLFDTAQTTANGRAQIAIGSYTGTGTFGSSNPCSLTFTFTPKVVIILQKYYSSTYLGIFINPSTLGQVTQSGSTAALTTTWTSSGLSWYHTSSADSQLNASGTPCYYAVFG